ncbi:MAG: DNA-3-methyladenine glycosylase, partial [Massilia sp.]|nr:DNA-3-methyladenine glycosylase [Massilia sp.]
MMALTKDTAGTTSLMLEVPPYWEQAKAELMKRDRIMKKLIPQFGDLHLVG